MLDMSVTEEVLDWMVKGGGTENILDISVTKCLYQTIHSNPIYVVIELLRGFKGIG